jgi:HD-like signal output (HDOD) protein
MDKIRIDMERLESIDSLPTLPTVATQLLENLGQVEVSLGAISKVMEQDPSITTQVLRIANSAYYGQRTRIDTVQRALVVLGVNEVINIILSLSLFKTFSYLREADFDLKEFWFHCGIVAYLSRHLAKRFNLRTHGEEFTAGLMHDLGKIVFAQYFHEDFLDVIDYLGEHHVPSHEAEKTVLGVSHNEIGYWLGMRWGIPAELLESIQWHHEPEKAKDFRETVALIHLADIHALRSTRGRYDIGWTPDPHSSTAWGMLGIDYNESEITELEGEIARETEKAMEFLSVVF